MRVAWDVMTGEVLTEAFGWSVVVVVYSEDCALAVLIDIGWLFCWAPRKVTQRHFWGFRIAVTAAGVIEKICGSPKFYVVCSERLEDSKELLVYPWDYLRDYV